MVRRTAVMRGRVVRRADFVVRRAGRGVIRAGWGVIFIAIIWQKETIIQ